MTYAINIWNSHPDEENDDCVTGDDFESKDAALAIFNDLTTWGYFSKHVFHEGGFIEIDGPDIYEVRKLREGEWKRSRKQKETDENYATACERSEALWQHRMTHGKDPE